MPKNVWAIDSLVSASDVSLTREHARDANVVQRTDARPGSARIYVKSAPTARVEADLT
ncbi:hypothetical protein GCM10020369_64130 [Cryptosporangium minutisporangium]|uniref:Uncharacterized protein n=1 Tax=Cryptosporangium minutisporangium TaxID=113569 RepID=A0ABP6T7W3_9ACTN